MYLKDFESLGKFKLIYCTGVLYHNAEQMRLLRKLYKLLEVGGCLVLESATFRGPKYLRNKALVQVYYPRTYRDTGTITHLPTAAAIKSWLCMVGFKKIYKSDCYRKYNRSIIGKRFACIAEKTGEDEAGAYYQVTGLNPKYPFGDSN